MTKFTSLSPHLVLDFCKNNLHIHALSPYILSLPSLFTLTNPPLLSSPPNIFKTLSIFSAKIMKTHQDEQSRVFHELLSMIIQILRNPPLPLPFPNPCYSSTGPSSSSSSRRPLLSSESSPATFASLFLGISLALMLFGSVTFVIGMLLMPWVVGLVLVFYVARIVSNLSDLVRSILSPAVSNKVVSPAW